MIRFVLFLGLFGMAAGQSDSGAVLSDSADPVPDSMSAAADRALPAPPPSWKISGTVVDAATGLFPADTSLSVVLDFVRLPLDSSGRFSIELDAPGRHLLRVRSSLYAPEFVTVTLDSIPAELIYAFQLEAAEKKAPLPRDSTAGGFRLTVKAPRIPLHRSAKVAAVTVTRRDLARAVAVTNDPVRVLQTLPGVASQSDANARPIIRGGGLEELRADLDGIPLLQPYHFGGVKSIFNTDAIDKMTLYRGDAPAQFHNALSGILAVDSRKPFDEPGFGLNADVNFLQYNTFVNLPLIKDRMGLNVTSQGSYYDWIKNRVAYFANLDESDYYALTELVQLPDYRDYTAGLGVRFNDQSTLYVNEMFHTDRWKAVEPDSIYTTRGYFSDGTSRDTSARNPDAFADAYQPGDTVRVFRMDRLSARFSPDTLFFYGSNYNILSSVWDQKLPGGQSVRIAAAWQRRTWDILFQEEFEFIGLQKYDVTLDQFNIHPQWRTRVRDAHGLTLGLQADYSRQTYDVNMPRFFHETITKGNANWGDMWGPFAGDSGIALRDDAITNLELLGSFRDQNGPRVVVDFKGARRYGNGALYGQDSWEVNRDLSLDLGLRLELSFADTSFSGSPRVSAKYRMNDRHEFLGSAGHFTQNNYDVSEIALSQSLRPPKVWQGNGTWAWQAHQNLRIESGFYLKEYRDLISEEIEALPLTEPPESLIVRLLDENDQVGGNVYMDSLRALVDSVKAANRALYDLWYEFAKATFQDYRAVFSNGGRGRSYGGELFLRYDPADWWSGWLSFTVQHAWRIRKPGYRVHPFPLDRPVLISLVNYYRLARQYEIAVKYRYMSGLPYTFTDFSEGIVVGPYNRKRYGPYFRFDLRVTKGFKLFSHQAHWYTEIWNAFNTPNAFLADRKTRDVKTVDINLPVTAIFLGLDCEW